MIDLIYLIGYVLKLKLKNSWTFDGYCTALVVFLAVVIAGIYL